jgi:hypothetical protein
MDSVMLNGHTSFTRNQPNAQAGETNTLAHGLSERRPPSPRRRERMRCGLRFTRAARYVLPIIAMLVEPSAGFAQELVCQTIRRGETAPQVARRVTGDSRNTYKASFQIMNAASRFIPKSQYDRIRPGWQACVIRPAVEHASLNVERVKAVEPKVSSDGSGASGSSDSRASLDAAVAAPSALAIVEAPNGNGWWRGIGAINLTMVWLGAAIVVPLFGWRVVDGYLTHMKTRSIVIRYFADRFVDEFKRPLVRYHAGERPVRARLRRGMRRGQFAILLAPGEGRRYPNLSDHKKNVEYDVARVLQVLGDESFVSGPLSAEAEWVVVPFQFLVPGSRSEGKIDSKQAGVTCISSF